MATADMECSLFQVCKEGNLVEFRRLYDADNSILNQKIPGLQETPLHLATRFNHNDLVKEILSHGNHTAEAMNREEETPLHVACRLGFLDIVNQLLPACSCVPYKRNRDGQCALFLACLCEHLDVALILCDSMDFGAWDVIGASCLWIAASKGYKGVVVKILDKNPSLAWSKDEDGFSAMHFAAREGKIKVIKELLRRDIHLSLLRENNGRTPLQLAAVNRKDAAVKQFLPGSTLYTTLEVLITDLINIADNDGNTILHHAATVNFSEILGILVTVQGMNVNAANKRGMTALDILEQQPVPTQRNNIIQQLGAALGANPISVTPVQQTLMVVAALVCTITFQAGLNPPGGFWPDSKGTNQTDHTGKNQTDHTAGKAIQNTTNPWVLMAFTFADAMAFSTALALIPTIIILPKKMMTYVNSLVVVAIVCLEVTFILGLVMVSDGMGYIIGEIGALIVPLPFFLWILW